MYTLLSHGSRIQVAQFFDEHWEQGGGETPKKEETMKNEIGKIRNDDRRQEETENRIATAKSQEAISNIGMKPEFLELQLSERLNAVFGVPNPKINLAQSPAPLA